MNMFSSTFLSSKIRNQIPFFFVWVLLSSIHHHYLVMIGFPFTFPFPSSNKFFYYLPLHLIKFPFHLMTWALYFFCYSPTSASSFTFWLELLYRTLCFPHQKFIGRIVSNALFGFFSLWAGCLKKNSWQSCPLSYQLFLMHLEIKVLMSAR